MAKVTKTIGTSSRDYSTITAWEADLDSSAIMGGIYSTGDDAVGECYNDSTFDEQVTIDGGGSVGLSSVKLTAPASERHNGTANSGVKIEYTGSTANSFVIKRSQCTVEWLELDMSSSGSSCNVGVSFGNYSASDAYLRNCIIHDLVTKTNHLHGIYVWGYGAASGSRYITNNIIYNIDSSSTTKESKGITVSSSNADVYLYNNTVYYVKTTTFGKEAYCFHIDDTSATLRNNIGARAIASSAFYQKDFHGSQWWNCDHDYNMSTDGQATAGNYGAGTNGVADVDYDDQFLSTSSGTEDLHLKAGADAIDMGVDLGTSPTNVNIDIDGRDRDAQSDMWDIGADQYVVSGASGGGAFPTVESVGEIAITSLTSTPSIPYPATVNNGDLLIVIASFGEGNYQTDITEPTGFTKLYAEPGGMTTTHHAVFLKKADGTESGNAEVTLSYSGSPSTSKGTMQIYRITGWSGTIADIEYALSTGSDDSPNPPTLAMTSGVAKNLWITVVHSYNDDESVSAYPATYSNGFNLAHGEGSNASTRTASCRREKETDTENPPTFTLSGSENYSVSTIGIRPAEDSGGIPIALFLIGMST